MAKHTPSQSSTLPPLWPHQRESIDFLKQNAHALLLDKPRMGKTRSVITAAKELRLNGYKLVLAGRAYLHVWLEELQQVWPDQPVVMLDYTGAQRQQALEELIQNYRAGGAWVIVTREGISQAKKYPILDLLTQLRPTLIVLDEFHHFRNPRIPLCKALDNLHAKYQWALSATPSDGDPRDYWVVLNWLFPKTYGTFWQFTNRYCEMKYNGFGWEYAKPKNESELADRIAGVSIQHTMEEVRGSPLPIQDSIVWLDHYPEEAEFYRTFEREMLVWFDSQTAIAAPTELAKITRLRQLASNMATLGYHGNCRKVDAIVEYCRTHRGSIAIGCEFKADAEFLCNALEAQNKGRVGLFTGKTRRPGDVLGNFRNGVTNRLIFTFAAGGEGVSMLTADHLLLETLPWSSIVAEQTKQRISSLQMKTKHLTTFLVRDTIEADIHALLQTKQFTNQRLLMSALREKMRRRFNANIH